MGEVIFIFDKMRFKLVNSLSQVSVGRMILCTLIIISLMFPYAFAEKFQGRGENMVLFCLP